MAGPVETYLKAIIAHDWTQLADLVTEDVVRTGPFFDVVEGRSDYVAFLSKLMPTLPNYSMDVGHISYVDDGRRAYAELTETLDVDGKPHRTPEVLVFEVTGERISRIDVFIKRKT
jgi:limonene-1,2-epoxide hydrolase